MHVIVFGAQSFAAINDIYSCKCGCAHSSVTRDILESANYNFIY